MRSGIIQYGYTSIAQVMLSGAENCRIKIRSCWETETSPPPTPVSSKTESYNDEAMMETPSVTDTTQVYDFKTEINPFSPLKTEENTQHYVFLNKRPKKIIASL